MSERIVFDVPAMLRAGGRLDALGGELSGLQGAVGGVSTAGFPPDLAGLARGELAHVKGDLASASTATVTQGEGIMRRAVQAQALDNAGDLDPNVRVHPIKGLRGADPFDLQGFLGGLGTTGITAARYLNGAREAGRTWLRESREPLRRAGRSAKWAQKLYDENGWARKLYGSPEGLRRNIGSLNKTIRRLDKATKVLDKLDPIEHLPPALRRNPLLRKAPIVGPILGFGGNLASGREPLDAAGRTAAETAGGAGGAVVGGALCGTAAAATFGLGAATCPVLTYGGGIAGGFAGGAVYDHADDVVKLPGKVVHFFTHPPVPGPGHLP